MKQSAGVTGWVLSLTFICGSARGEAPTSVPVNTAIVPDLQPRFAAKHEANVAIAQKGDIDLLFMGDSITDWWGREAATTRPTSGPASTRPFIEGAYGGKPVFDRYFGSMKIANFGIAGDTTQGVLFRLRHGEGQGFSPKAIMLMIGTNNTANNSAHEIADGVTADLRELQKDFPSAKILLLAIFPRNGPPVSVEKIPQINSAIAKLADGEKVVYLDLTDRYVGPDGKVPSEIMSDGLHPTTKGYEIWAKAVIEPIKKLMQ